MEKAGFSSTLIWALKRDLLVAVRRRGDLAATLFFFVMVASLFPLGVGPEPQMLRTMAPGIVWVAALLASTLALNRLFASDFADGTLEQILLSPEPLALLIIGKMLAHWLISGLPLVLISPLIALQFDQPGEAYGPMILSLLLGTPLLSLIGGIGAALTLGIRGSGVMATLLVLPLYVPVLIFGASAISTGATGVDISGQLSILGALLLLGLATTPWAISVALRIAVE
ncbi:MAG: heme exporter protein CcmB [Thiobacillaceae bacterium]|jgi:heme exporter protein B